MLSRDARTSNARTSTGFLLADRSVRVHAPEGVLAVLDDTLSFVPRLSADCDTDVVISVRPRSDLWEIRGQSGAVKILGAQCALPQVAGAVVSSAVHEVAESRHGKSLRASVVEKDGRALAMVGDDWDSAITLAAHLHARGWKFIGSDNVLLDPVTLDVYPVQKSLYVNASSIAQFPIDYRRAVETSPWYVTAQGISFYAVDPCRAGRAQTWAAPTQLHGVVIVDGSMDERPSLESVDERTLGSDRFDRLGIDWSRVSSVDLCIGGFADTCDILEHWFESVIV